MKLGLKRNRTLRLCLAEFVSVAGSPGTSPWRWEGATEAGKGPAWPVSPERAASGLPASPAAGTPARLVPGRYRGRKENGPERAERPRGQRAAPANGKPARSQARSPFRPGLRLPGSGAAAPRSPAPAGPRGHCRCRPHLPFQPEAARAPPVTQAEAAPPPAPPALLPPQPRR